MKIGCNVLEVMDQQISLIDESLSPEHSDWKKKFIEARSLVLNLLIEAERGVELNRANGSHRANEWIGISFAARRARGE